jgi:acetylornithine/succinyldiaminopimelate/putrescine aminotransferase
MEISKRVEKFIQDYTSNCYNYNSYAQDPIPWLTPDQARRAVEIAREEMIEWIDSHWREYINVYADGVVCIGHWKNDLIKAMKNE